MPLRERFAAAASFEQFVAGAKKNQDLWRGVYHVAHVPDAVVERAQALAASYHLLFLAEDWCGDAANTVPPIVRLTELTSKLDARLLARDANPDLMNAHLTNTSRSIPVVMVLDEDFEECGWWGPRPAELQSWVIETGLTMPSPDRYRVIRTWYARDHARSTFSELLQLLERCSPQPYAPPAPPASPFPLPATDIPSPAA